ncbi:MAG: PadR family transcriptional regulator [Bacteroides sp.]|nr:PadR family transcriptional regulator [Bacteroides sp.]MDE7510053.1 PadR family transcriptional regulator [Muribaculaceae bacterium]
MNEDNVRTQMRKGILEFCVLLLLSRERAYPSDILNRLKAAKLIVVEGTLYALLNRLRKEGHLTYEWEESTMGPPRKYYMITPEGMALLEVMKNEWRQISASIDCFLPSDESNA